MKAALKNMLFAILMLSAGIFTATAMNEEEIASRSAEQGSYDRQAAGISNGTLFIKNGSKLTQVR